MRTRIEDVRRRDLTEAALETLRRHGLQGATVARVASTLGMSQGIVHHYFKDKTALLEAAMRRANAELSAEVVALLRTARGPRERLVAVIEGNFAARSFTPEVARAWLAFLAEVPRAPGFARIQRVMQRRMHSNLLHGFKALLPEPEAERAARGLGVLIDGLWLRLALGVQPIHRPEALAIARGYLDQWLGAAPGAAGNGSDGGAGS